jgi:hypothetical protein
MSAPAGHVIGAVGSACPDRHTCGMAGCCKQSCGLGE